MNGCGWFLQYLLSTAALYFMKSFSFSSRNPCNIWRRQDWYAVERRCTRPFVVFNVIKLLENDTKLLQWNHTDLDTRHLVGYYSIFCFFMEENKSYNSCFILQWRGCCVTSISLVRFNHINLFTKSIYYKTTWWKIIFQLPTVFGCRFVVMGVHVMTHITTFQTYPEVKCCSAVIIMFNCDGTAVPELWNQWCDRWRV